MVLRFVILLLAACVAVPASKTNPAPRHLPLGVIMPGETDALTAGLLAATDAHEPLVVVDIDSPGGAVSVGFDLIDQSRAYRAAGGKLLCRVNGMAASMAAIYLEAACDVRVMTLGSQLMFHEPSLSDVSGKESDLRRWADRLADANRQSATLIAWRLGMSTNAYIKWVSGRDRWLDAAESLQRGAIDAIE